MADKTDNERVIAGCVINYHDVETTFGPPGHYVTMYDPDEGQDMVTGPYETQQMAEDYFEDAMRCAVEDMVNEKLGLEEL